MFFMSTSICGGKRSADNTALVTDAVKDVEIQNGVFDKIMLTKKTGTKMGDFLTWDYNTLFDADFRDSLVAGNVSYMLSQISAMRVKRRKKGEYRWVLMFEVPINKESDLVFDKYDRYAANDTEYEYALVPVLNGREGYLNPSTIKTKFYGCFILEKDKGFSTDLDVKRGTIVRNKPANVVTTLSGRYPYIVSNGDTDYESGTFSMMFLPKADNQDYTKEGAMEYRERVKDFLNDGEPKIIKTEDGRIWMVAVTNGVTEEHGEIEGYVHHSFDWVEIGDPESAEDLYNNNFIDVGYI